MSVLMAFLHICSQPPHDYKGTEGGWARRISRRGSSFSGSEGETLSIPIFSFLTLLLASSAFLVPRQLGIPCAHTHTPPPLPHSPCQPWEDASRGRGGRAAAGDPWSRALPVLPACPHQVALQERLSGATRPPGTAPAPAPATRAAGAPPAAKHPPFLLLNTRAAGTGHPGPACCRRFTGP